MKKKIFYSIIIFLISFKLHSLEVTLTQGSIKPTPIAITNFFSNEVNSQKIGKNISNVISNKNLLKVLPVKLKTKSTPGILDVKNVAYIIDMLNIAC